MFKVDDHVKRKGYCGGITSRVVEVDNGTWIRIKNLKWERMGLNHPPVWVRVSEYRLA